MHKNLFDFVVLTTAVFLGVIGGLGYLMYRAII